MVFNYFLYRQNRTIKTAWFIHLWCLPNALIFSSRCFQNCFEMPYLNRKWRSINYISHHQPNLFFIPKLR